MTRLEDRITSSLHNTAKRLPGEGANLAAEASESAPRTARGPAVALIAMAAVLVVIGGSTFVLSSLNGNDDGDVVGAAGAAVAPDTGSYPIVGYAPPGSEVGGASYSVISVDWPEASVTVVVARTTADGFTESVVVDVVDESDMSSFLTAEPIDEIDVNGHTAKVYDLGDVVGGVAMSWLVGDRTVMVRAPLGDMNLARGVAESVMLVESDTFDASIVTFESLPSGIVVIASARMQPRDSTPVVMIHRDDGSATAEVTVWPGLVPENIVGSFGAATVIELRDRDVYRSDTSENGAAYVWTESAGVTAMVFGDFPESELEKIVAGLSFVNESEWQGHYGIAGSDIAAPSTAVPHVEDTATTSTTAVVGDAPRLLVDLPGWNVVRYDDHSPIDGEMTFFDGQYALDVTWRAADTHDPYVDDRANSSEPPREITVNGFPATEFQYSGTTDFTTLWIDGERSFEARGEFPDRESYEAILAALATTDFDTWLEAMPDSVVKPIDRDAVIAVMLSDIPKPDGFDREALVSSVGVKDRYQLGATVVSSVACLWIEQWADARTSGDTVVEAEAIDAMASSHDWAILVEMDAEGGYSGVVWEYADAIGNDGTVIGGRILTVQESYSNALGCGNN